MPGSDAGSDGVTPASVSSYKTVRPRALCAAQCSGHAIIGRGLQFVQRRRTRINLVKEQDPICAGTNGIAQHQFTSD